MYYVYVLKSKRDFKYYIGYTKNVRERLKRHNQGREKSTLYRRPFIIQYYKQFETRVEAIRYERYLKRQKSHKKIDELFKLD